MTATMTMTQSQPSLSSFSPSSLSALGSKDCAAAPIRPRSRCRAGSFKVIATCPPPCPSVQPSYHSHSQSNPSSYNVPPGLISPPLSHVPAPAYQSSPPYTFTPKTGEITIQFGEDPYGDGDEQYQDSKFVFDPFTDEPVKGASQPANANASPCYAAAATAAGGPLSLSSFSASGKPSPNPSPSSSGPSPFPVPSSWLSWLTPQREAPIPRGRGRALTPTPAPTPTPTPTSPLKFKPAVSSSGRMTGYIPIELFTGVPQPQPQTQMQTQTGAGAGAGAIDTALKRYQPRYAAPSCDREAAQKVLAGILLNRTGKKGAKRRGSRRAAAVGASGKRAYVRSGLSVELSLDQESSPEEEEEGRSEFLFD